MGVRLSSSILHQTDSDAPYHFFLHDALYDRYASSGFTDVTCSKQHHDGTNKGSSSKQTLHKGHIKSSKVKIFPCFIGSHNVFRGVFIYYHKLQRRCTCSTYRTQTLLKLITVFFTANVH